MGGIGRNAEGVDRGVCVTCVRAAGVVSGALTDWLTVCESKSPVAVDIYIISAALLCMVRKWRRTANYYMRHRNYTA